MRNNKEGSNNKIQSPAPPHTNTQTHTHTTLHLDPTTDLWALVELWVVGEVVCHDVDAARVGTAGHVLHNARVPLVQVVHDCLEVSAPPAARPRTHRASDWGGEEQREMGVGEAAKRKEKRGKRKGVRAW